jgi:predicted Zn finger-like uncharacterized protein
MVVSCPKCSSRYQLSDEKIRSAGTKVRCPRCQNTFKVFPENPSKAEEEVEKTELSLPRHDFLKKQSAPKNPPPQAPAPSKEDVETGIRAHRPAASAPETMRSSKTREPSPFKRPQASTDPFDQSNWEDFESSDERRTTSNTRSTVEPKTVSAQPPSDDSSEDTAKASPNSSEPKPFGDATFLAIQKMGGAKEGRKKTLVALSFGLLAVSLAVFFLLAPQTKAPLEVTQNEAQNTVIKLTRPNNWYQDNPSVLQKFLSQMATLPKVEQDKPESKALIAEALVLNGIMTGAYDQVAQGTAIASDLITAYPTLAYGFYARAAYAVYKDDSSGLATLSSNWPKGNQMDPEYLLINSLVLAKGGQRSTALLMAKDLIEKLPDFQRAQYVALSIALDSSKEAEATLGDKKIASLTKAFTKAKESFQTNGSALPDLFNNIDKKMLRRSSAMTASKSAETSPPAPMKPEIKAEAKTVKVNDKKKDDSLTKSLNEKAQKQLTEKTTEKKEVETTAESAPAPAVQTVEKPKVEPSPEKAAPDKAVAEKPTPKTPAKTTNKLPPPDSELIASNKQARKEESEAGKLYQMGLTQIEQGRPDEAIMSFQKSLRFDPDYAESYRKLGEIYMKKDERDKALRSLKIYLRLRPDSSDRQVVQGWISSLE